MKIVPVIKSGDLERSLHLYTQVLDFERNWPGSEDHEMARYRERALLSHPAGRAGKTREEKSMTAH
jgi:hypothetical protein